MKKGFFALLPKKVAAPTTDGVPRPLYETRETREKKEQVQLTTLRQTAQTGQRRVYSRRETHKGLY